MQFRNSILKICVLMVLGMSFQFCSSSKKAADGDERQESGAALTYTKDVQPLILRSCSPCHFPDQGRVKFLDTYSSIRNNISEILMRVQLPVHDEKYMPYLSKKQALSRAEIEMLKRWVAQKMSK